MRFSLKIWHLVATNLKMSMRIKLPDFMQNFQILCRILSWSMDSWGCGPKSGALGGVKYHWPVHKCLMHSKIDLLSLLYLQINFKTHKFVCLFLTIRVHVYCLQSFCTFHTFKHNFCKKSRLQQQCLNVQEAQLLHRYCLSSPQTIHRPKTRLSGKHFCHWQYGSSFREFDSYHFARNDT